MQNILAQAETLDDVQAFILKLRAAYDTEHFVYHSVKNTGEEYAAFTYEQDWVDRYIEQEYTRIDPVVQSCYRHFRPVDWKSLDWSTKASRRFLSEAIDTGLGNQGLSIPIRGPNGQFALFSVNHKCSDEKWRVFTDECVTDLLLIAHFMNEKALQIEGAPDESPKRALSPREKDTLALLAAGNNRANIAETLKISENTLRVYIESARSKLGAANTTHAVAMALHHGLIIV